MAKLEQVADARLPTPFAEFRLRIYLAEDGKEHVALTLGDLGGEPPLVRVHSECLTGDALFSLRCDCGFQLEHALQRIASERRGALVYLRQEGRGIGLANKIRAYALQDQGADTVEANAHLGFGADLRDYGLAVDILKDLGVGRLRLLTNNPRKLNALTDGGMTVVERVAILCGRNPHNEGYLSTKADKLGHLLRPAPRE
ncbi:MAG TPA: GTP cyclohydrolase II [Verrucomicrobiae bacterium]|nr:GTP cyclohydrolase II [Verrucomicrobiae bacterium]